MPSCHQPLSRDSPSSHSILNNDLGDSADTLVAAARELPQLVTLCGIQPEQEAVDFSNRCLGPADAKLLAFDLSKNQTIKTLKYACFEPTRKLSDARHGTATHPAQRLNFAWTLCLRACICVSSQ